MTNYRRSFVLGRSFFFTVNLADRRLRLLTDHIQALRSAFRYTKLRHPFRVDAIVVLPDHLHAIWTLPQGEADFALRWRLIKATFSRGLRRMEPISPSRARKGERRIWQRRYWDTPSETNQIWRDTLITFTLIRSKHGHVGRVQDWPYSSFHRMVRLGLYPEGWAGEAEKEASGFGER